MGWICGEDIDVSIVEGNKNAADAQEEEEEVPLEVQLGKGESMNKSRDLLNNLYLNT